MPGKYNGQPCPNAAERTENMSDPNIKNLSGNITGDNQPSRKTALGSKDGFLSYFRKLLLIGFLVLLLPVSSVAQNNACHRMPMLMERFLDNHYAMKSMTDELKTHAVDQMIKSLDPSKTLLYESDLENLRPVLQNAFTRMQSGDCTPLQQVYDMLVARARENETIIKKILGPDYRLDDTVELNIDIDKRPYVKTAAQKYELLKKVVQFQIENALLSGTDLAEAKKQQIHRYELQTRRIVERTPEELITNVAKSFALALDPHTSYLSPENLEDIRIQMQLSLEGIGALLKNDNGFTIIEELIPGGGAEKSGLLHPNDKIIAVAQDRGKPVDVIDMDLRDVVSMIRGKKGSRVTLTILRQTPHKDRFDVTIMRDKIDMKEQEAKITYEMRKSGGKTYRFGIIDLPSFYGGETGGKSSYKDVKRLLARARQQHVDGIVLDLSRNGGGLLDEAVRIAGLFIGKGGIVATKDSRGQVTILTNGSNASEGDRRKVIEFPAEDPRSIYTGPLVVLTSRMSASASEIVAGALKDYHRAVIIGSDRTFGKGSVQTLKPLPGDMGGMKVTTALYFLPGGKSTQKTGVEADVRLPIWFALEEVGETALDYPLPAQTIAPFLDMQANAGPPTWKPVEQSLITKLAAKSRARVDKDVKFAEIIRNNKEAAGKKGIIRLADLRKEMKKENGGKKNETSAELRKKARDQYAPFVNESVNVLLDMAAADSAQRI
ncbi:MAG: tail-specific protease [Deltaproteobacteria bacterium HGW-Deltaproteobacteria-13]|jgi:carboxyl-terminal processing protease|nr:MAG: tail-specific protease [Deltaproteobacteria bacterium HGW-Deltaproteobacteria-13]